MSLARRPPAGGVFRSIANVASSAASSPAVHRLVQTGINQAFRSVKRAFDGTPKQAEQRARQLDRANPTPTRRAGYGSHLQPGFMRTRSSRLLSSRRLLRARPRRSSRRAPVRRRKYASKSRRTGAGRGRRSTYRRRRSAPSMSRRAILKALAPSYAERSCRGNGVTTGIVMNNNAPMTLPGYTFAHLPRIGSYGYHQFLHHNLSSLVAVFGKLRDEWGSWLTPELASPTGPGAPASRTTQFFQAMRVAPRRCRLEIANTSGSAVVFDCFIVKPRRFMNHSGGSIFHSPLEFAASSFQQTVTVGTSVSSSSRLDPLDVGVDFFKAPNFQRYYRCRRAFSVRLTHGQTAFKAFTVPGFIWNALDRGPTKDNTETTTSIGPHTTFVIYRLKGQTGAFEPNVATIYNSASYSAASVHMTLNFMSKYSAIPLIRPTLYVSTETHQDSVDPSTGAGQVTIANEFGKGEIIVPPFLSVV